MVFGRSLRSDVWCLRSHFLNSGHCYFLPSSGLELQIHLLLQPQVICYLLIPPPLLHWEIPQLHQIAFSSLDLSVPGVCVYTVLSGWKPLHPPSFFSILQTIPVDFPSLEYEIIIKFLLLLEADPKYPLTPCGGLVLSLSFAMTPWTILNLMSTFLTVCSPDNKVTGKWSVCLTNQYIPSPSPVSSQ